MITRNDNRLTGTSLNRRTLLKRAGILGLTVPAAGMLFNACGTAEEIPPVVVPVADNSKDVASTANIADAGPVELTITAKDIHFEPTLLEAPAGSKVILTLVNEGMLEHDWEAPELKVNDLTVISAPEGMSNRMTERLAEAQDTGFAYAGAPAGTEMVVSFTVTEPGAYEMLCIVPGHAQAGMTGTFNVLTAEGEVVAAAPAQHHDGHIVVNQGAGTPYDAPRLPNPVVAPPVGDREPTTIKQEIFIKEVIGYLDEGVAFEFWTFDGTVPGPMLRARVGDTIELTLTNPPESKATHNIDLHSVTGQGGGAEASLVAPGESATFKFKAMNPGVFVYHCAVAPIPHHISAGMYGLMVVEPEGGLPPVDKEFYVMQGDIYLDGHRTDKGLREFSMDKMLDERPDYVVLNGAVGSIAGDRAFKVNVGDTVRIFYGVGGPNLVSSFHIIGEIFDRVMVEGATEWSTNIQTTLVPAGGATIVEFTAEVPSTLMMVDHSLGRLHKGCVGMIEVEGPENPEIFEALSTERAG
jgi:nitrite reductase (NO-forming)